MLTIQLVKLNIFKRFWQTKNKIKIVSECFTITPALSVLVCVITTTVAADVSPTVWLFVQNITYDSPEFSTFP